VPGVLFVFKCRFVLGFPLVLDAGNGLKGEYLGPKFTEGGPTLGRVGLGAWIVTFSSSLAWGDCNLWMMSLLAILGTRRCRDNGEAERNGGLEDVEAGVGVTEVDGGLKCNPLCEIDGTLGLPEVANIIFVEADGVGSHDDGGFGEFSMLRRFETEATRGLEGNVRWPGPVTELGVPGSPVVDALTLAESLVTFEVMRTDGVGLG